MSKEQKKADTKKTRRPAALKRDLQSEKSRLRNKMYRSTVRTAVRSFDETVTKGDVAQIKASLSEVHSLLDKGVKKGVFKVNKASRTKSRLAARAATAKV